MVYRAATGWPVRPFDQRWVYSSAGEHYLDMVGVTGSIPVTPTISTQGIEFPWIFTGRGVRRMALPTVAMRMGA
jgi:hypothetical protein